MKLIIRSHCHANFTMIPNSTLRDNALSLKARGLLALALSNREDWQMTKEWVCENVPEGRQAVSGAFRELRKAGYLSKQIVKDSVTGKVETTVWVFRDTPLPPEERELVTEIPTDGKPNDGNPTVGFPHTKKTIGRRRPSEEDKDRQSPSDSAGSGGHETPGTEDSEDSDLSKRRKEEIPPPSFSVAPPLPGMVAAAAPEPPEGGGQAPDGAASTSKPRKAGGKTPKAAKPPADPRHKLLIDTFAEEFEKHFQAKYLFQGAKDAVAVKSLIMANEGTSVEEIMRIIRFGWTHRDAFLRSASTTLARIPSIWNQLRAQVPRTPVIPGGLVW